MHPLFHPLFVKYCAYFNGNQDYFECHEVLEEYWKTVAPGDKNHPLVGYVQVAVGMYHWRRNNTAGALRMLEKALSNFTRNQGSAYFDFLNFSELYIKCEFSLEAIKTNEPFRPFLLQLRNEEFAELVSKEIAQLPSFSKDFLLHKHMRRDRSDILRERDAKLKSRPGRPGSETHCGR